MITVKKLIEHLKQFPQDLPVAYDKYSESQLLEIDEIRIKRMQPPRKDGWVHSPWSGEPKLPEIEYLVFPGN